MTGLTGQDWRARAGTHFQTSKQAAVASEVMVAANHPLASAAGLEMVARGGNAVDAAIATAFALTVVEPMMVSIFGAGMILLRDGATGEIVNIDNYAVAPAAARPDLYQPVEGAGDPFATVGQANATGYLAVGVPGALPAWTALQAERGRLTLGEVMAPAIRYAADGFAVSPYLAHCIDLSAAGLAQFPASAEVFLPDGKPPIAGSAIVRGDYARTLERIASGGTAEFTHGAIAEAVAEDMRRNGGLITLDDLASYRFERRTPVRGHYRGYEIVSAAPTSSGGTHIVQALNILEGFDLAASGFGTVQTLHLLAETLEIAFADRAAYQGDPEVVDVPIDWLTSKEYAAERRRDIHTGRVGQMVAGTRPGSPSSGAGRGGASWPGGSVFPGTSREPAESGNTTHLTVMDGQGNVVSMTQTLNTLFGSKVTVPGTGMLLNNCMMLFDPRPGRPNSVAARKRMLSSMSPTIVLKDGQPYFALGTPGGLRIWPAVLQAIINVLDHGMTLQEAVEAPRIWTQGGPLELEEDFGTEVRADLTALGYPVQVVHRVAGGMNGVLCAPSGEAGRPTLHGAACWRADGTPAGFSGGFTSRIAAPGVPL